jgi:hypothetical protein
MSLYALDCPPDAQGYGENYESLFVDTHEMRGGGCLLAWRKVQRSMQLDDLGILDLRLFGSALRL